MNNLVVGNTEANAINQLIQDANQIIKKDYYNSLDTMQICPYKRNGFIYANNIRLLKIDKIVFEENDNVINKLLNVYSSILSNEGSLILIIDAGKDVVDFYLGIKVTTGQTSVLNVKDTLFKTLEGNFPGMRGSEPYISDIENMMQGILANNNISVVNGIPDLKDDKENFVQGIEKLIESMKGEEYAAIFIADSLDPEEFDLIEQGYENIYSLLSACAEQSITIGTTEGINISESESVSITKSLSKATSNTTGTTRGASIGGNLGNSTSKTKSFGGSLGTSMHKSVNSTVKVPGIGSVGATIGSSITASAFASVAKMVGQSIGASLGLNTSISESRTESETRSISKQVGNTQTKGVSSSNSNSIQLNIENKTIKSLLKKIDCQLDRMKQSKNYGLWQTGAYFLADSYKISRTAADAFSSLIKGESSSLEKSIVHTWNEENENLSEIKKYIKNFHHPIFQFKNPNSALDTIKFKPTSMVSTKELAIQFGLPRKSIPGLTCTECAEFGRNIIKYSSNEEQTIKIGRIYHLGRLESQTIDISVNSLCKHTLVTGSTGTGKSNVIYKMLNELNKQGIKFLVIEPAKGEYKEIFGGRKDVNVFGTNIEHTELLKINPFKFPKGIHVLEHVDRLIEILNAVWPMYAAMPAILKQAIEEAYQVEGWDLDNSINDNAIRTYPSFYSLLEILPNIINKSSYSAELKSNYIGALVTRVHSLTNGLLGKIFNDTEIDEKDLFDKNTIVDISRIGSLETKSLLMGIIFLKLQEYRMVNSTQMNSDLKHVTVLEEAHHLLRKTSTDQSQDTGNLQGKAVEMISNSIAEMRTYGEGFIIADQTPNLLDESAIKNTNTKIVLRLPSIDDRINVGGAMNLKEQQINELSKIETGVAAIYQNDWESCVLGKIDYYKEKYPYSYEYDLKKEIEKEKLRKTEILKLILNNRVDASLRSNRSIENFRGIENYIQTLQLKSHTKKILLESIVEMRVDNQMVLWDQNNYPELANIVDELLNLENAYTRYRTNAETLQALSDFILDVINKKLILEVGSAYKAEIIKAVLRTESVKTEKDKDIYFKWEELRRKGDLKIC